MTVSEKEIRAVLWSIHGVFPQRFPLPMGEGDAAKKAKAQLVALWFALLEDLPGGSALLSARSKLREAVHPPTPAEIRRGALAAKLAGTAGAEAWGEVSRAIGRRGMNRTPVTHTRKLGPDEFRFSEPAIARSVAAIGGWKSICTSSNSVADRSQFIRHFDGVQESARGQVLIGSAKSIAEAIDGHQQEQLDGSIVAGLLDGGNS